MRATLRGVYCHFFRVKAQPSHIGELDTWIIRTGEDIQTRRIRIRECGDSGEC